MFMLHKGVWGEFVWCRAGKIANWANWHLREVFRARGRKINNSEDDVAVWKKRDRILKREKKTRAWRNREKKRKRSRRRTFKISKGTGKFLFKKSSPRTPGSYPLEHTNEEKIVYSTT